MKLARPPKWILAVATLAVVFGVPAGFLLYFLSRFDPGEWFDGYNGIAGLHGCSIEDVDGDGTADIATCAFDYQVSHAFGPQVTRFAAFLSIRSGSNGDELLRVDLLDESNLLYGPGGMVPLADLDGDGISELGLGCYLLREDKDFDAWISVRSSRTGEELRRELLGLEARHVTGGFLKVVVGSRASPPLVHFDGYEDDLLLSPTTLEVEMELDLAGFAFGQVHELQDLDEDGIADWLVCGNPVRVVSSGDLSTLREFPVHASSVALLPDRSEANPLALVCGNDFAVIDVLQDEWEALDPPAGRSWFDDLLRTDPHSSGLFLVNDRKLWFGAPDRWTRLAPHRWAVDHLMPLRDVDGNEGNDLAVVYFPWDSGGSSWRVDVLAGETGALLYTMEIRP